MLEGYDKTWSPVLKKREDNFRNINEGTYTFKLKAQYTGPDGNNNWSEVLTYTFKVLPPWYRTWWMYSVYIMLLVAFIWLVVWWNGRRLRARAKELTEEVRKATVTIVEQKVEVEKQKKAVEEKHKEVLDSIRYAKRIQDALLTSQGYIERNLKRLKGNG
jgi:hypothetical protein